LLSSFRFHESRTSRGFEDRTAAVDYPSDRSPVQIDELTVYEPFIAAHNSNAFFSVEKTSTRNRSYRGVHSWSVTSAC
jgi:hypothetical protein